MLEVRDARASYGGPQILNGVNLSVAAGEVVAIVGRNGVGKTTLLRYMMGLVPRCQGTVSLEGKDVSSQPTHRRAMAGMGYVPQGRQIFPRLSVLDNIRVGLIARGQTADGKLDRVLDYFPILRERLTAPGGTLSGGQQQMLAIARALVVDPRILLLDEPTEGIQPSIVDEIADTLLQINQSHRLSIIFVEQNLSFAARLAQRAYIMDRGAVRQEVSMERLLSDAELQQDALGV